jgi:sarcosine oxidase, subunit beta
MTGPSVAIVGGGALGLSTAWHLLRLGVRAVTVVEAGPSGGDSTSLSVGVIETQYLEPLQIELRARSMEFFRTLERDRGLEIVRTGYLRLAHDDALLPEFGRSVEVQRSLGIADVRILDRGDIEALVPDMRCDDLRAGLWGPSDGYIDPHRYTTILAAMIREEGGRILTQSRMTGVARAPSGGFRLDTTAGEVVCDVVVNAAGAWAGKVGTMLGTEVPVLPQRHQAAVVHVPRPLDYPMPMVMDYIPHSGGLGLYFRPEARDKLIAGLHTEDPLHGLVDPDGYRRAVDPSFLEQVAAKIADRLPGLGDCGLAHGWAGLYPMSPDGAQIVGPAADDSRVFVVAGGGGSGLQASPALGLVAAEWIANGAPRSVPGAERLRPGREIHAPA